MFLKNRATNCFCTWDGSGDMWCAVVAMVILFDVLNFIWSMVIESSATLLSCGFCNSLAVIGFSFSFKGELMNCQMAKVKFHLKCLMYVFLFIF
ncbi:uncharacterized protein LOC136083958 isoform X2 [Hydra vulgaris]|uniref:Uncharacterized protein LOC136083958 isoform X2 n=1 Tax=Hydra vulgaris TaxID=6087 RepID=A0ABM4CE79_HYDVU